MDAIAGVTSAATRPLTRGYLWPAPGSNHALPLSTWNSLRHRVFRADQAGPAGRASQDSQHLAQASNPSRTEARTNCTHASHPGGSVRPGSRRFGTQVVPFCVRTHSSEPHAADRTPERWQDVAKAVADRVGRTRPCDHPDSGAGRPCAPTSRSAPTLAMFARPTSDGAVVIHLRGKDGKTVGFR
jgi:hypothetical protein